MNGNYLLQDIEKGQDFLEYVLSHDKDQVDDVLYRVVSDDGIFVVESESFFIVMVASDLFNHGAEKLFRLLALTGNDAHSDLVILWLPK